MVNERAGSPEAKIFPNIYQRMQAIASPLETAKKDPWCQNKEIEIYSEMPGVKSRDDDIDAKRESISQKDR